MEMKTEERQRILKADSARKANTQYVVSMLLITFFIILIGVLAE